jgi:hypothetical protein
MVSGDDFAADDCVRLDAALAAQGHDVTASVTQCGRGPAGSDPPRAVTTGRGSCSKAWRPRPLLSQAHRQVTAQKLSPSSARLAGVP